MFQSRRSRVRAWRALAGIALLLLATGLFSCGSGDEAPDIDTPASRAALADYRAYLDESSDTLVHWAETIVAKFEEDSVPKAGSRYAAARVPYGHVRPAAELIEPLNSRIDSTEAEAAPDGRGFNELEKAIFLDKDIADQTPLARRVLADVEELKRRLAKEKFTPAEILDGASKALERLTTLALKGKEEPNALNDLTDVAAGLEGLEATLAAVKPVLKEADPELVKQLEAQFQKAYEKVSEWGTFAKEPEQSRPQEPGIAFVIYSEFSPQSVREFSEPVEALVPLFAQAQEAVEGG